MTVTKEMAIARAILAITEEAKDDNRFELADSYDTFIRILKENGYEVVKK